MSHHTADHRKGRAGKTGTFGWIALVISAAYGFVGALWIGFSDQFVAQLGLPEDQLTRVQQYKGWGYVVVTALMLYLLLSFTLGRLESSLRALRRSRDRLDTLNRLYRMVRAVKGAVLRQGDVYLLLDETCRVAVSEGGYRLAWIALLDPDGRRVRAGAHAGVGKSLIRDKVLDRDQLPPQSPVRRALEHGKLVICNHCPDDPILAGRDGTAAGLGYGSIAAIPLRSANGIQGCFTVYAQRAQAFDQREASLLLEIGQTIEEVLQILDDDTPVKARIRPDPVTGLPDRQSLEQNLALAVARAHRREEQVALIVLDIDDFRRTNDTLGRKAGDKILRLVARLLSTAIQPGDIIARLGNDEFAVVLTDHADDRAIGATVDRIAKCFPQKLSIDEHETFVLVSMGIAVFPADAQDATELFGCAELAQHSNPPEARGQIRYYEPGLNKRARRQRELDSALRGADPEQKAFHLAWQPIVAVESETLVGAEALLRWKHPRLGNIPPDIFIPLAEASGQIIEIGHWVLREAIRQGDAWSESGLAISIHVNVSLLQLQHAGFVDDLEKLLIRKRHHNWRLVVEITESQMMADPETTAMGCRRIGKLGCGIHMDDFGTGFSSLNYLSRLPLDGVKLDRSFVIQARDTLKMKTVVEEVIRMARKLGLAVTAEGVETSSHLDLLRSFKCHYAQGYLFGKPDSAEHLTNQWHRSLKANQAR